MSRALKHRFSVTSPAPAFQNVASGCCRRGAPYGEANDAQGSSVGRVLTDIYFIAQGAGTNNRNQTPWSLWRKVSEDAPVELVEGIEGLKFDLASIHRQATR
jgi:hypothetical protein